MSPTRNVFAAAPVELRPREVGATIGSVRFGGALIILAACMGAVPAAAAQDVEPICADRPGLATPTCTVPAGMVQVETSLIDWTSDRDGGVRAAELSVGETALKLGLSERLHIELVVSPFNRSRVSGAGARETLSGFGDLVAAAKLRFTQDDSPVQVAARPYVKLPTARRPLGNGKVEGGLVVPIEIALPGQAPSLTFAPQLDVVADGDGSGHHVGTGQVVSLGFDVAPSLSASAEIGAYWDFDPDGKARQYSAGLSAAYLLSNDAQIDVGANLGLNREAPDVQLYSGIAFRF